MQRQIRKLSLALLAALAVAGCEKKGASSTTEGGLEVAQSRGDEFAVSASVDGEVTTGTPAQLLARVEAKKGFHINAEYPVSFRPEKAGEGISFEKDRFLLAESAERIPCGQGSPDACELRAKVPFTATAAGDHSVRGVLAFSVCTDEKCLIEKAPIDVKVTAR